MCLFPVSTMEGEEIFESLVKNIVSGRITNNKNKNENNGNKGSKVFGNPVERFFTTVYGSILWDFLSDKQFHFVSL